ncbi:MAG: glutamate-5-semialdehyde dehydrogenase [Bacteroidales bacterium]|nr:glutamate-5-semialdehyde dehydrogenase [Bacteroidales bacterium]
MSLSGTFAAVRKATASVAALKSGRRAEILVHVADNLLLRAEELLAANAEDLSRMERSNPLYDRLLLTPERINSIASDMKAVASLPDPLNHTIEDRTLPNGLRLRKVSVPFGVIGVIYEARPNVTFDVFSICFKSGNCCILKGGRDACHSNEVAESIIRDTLVSEGVNPDAARLLPATHEAALEMLGAVGQVDLVIPRGGKKLISFVRENAKVPCIETGAGVVNCYFDEYGDLEMGRRIIENAKTRRVSVCNALDCLLVHASRLAELPELVGTLAGKSVVIYADGRAYSALEASYPSDLLFHADGESFGTEFMDWKMALKVVDSLEECLQHIDRYGSGHSESIVTTDAQRAETFQLNVDAACVYVNAPTSFTDGGQFGLGAEIGISTQKLGPRGPMGLCEMTTYKWLINGSGQVRG